MHKRKQSEIFSNNHALDRENNTVHFNISQRKQHILTRNALCTPPSSRTHDVHMLHIHHTATQII